MDDGAAVSDVLDERPELAEAMKAVLTVDDEHDEWTFDDVPVDSGTFGELVSRGLVEGTDDDGYRVARPDDVRAALDRTTDGDTGGTMATETGQPSQFGSGSGGTVRDRLNGMVSNRPDGTVRDRLTDLDRYTVGSLLGALLAVAVARAYVFGTVFRDGVVVLSGNDPYYYRYWVEQALAASGGVFDVSGLATLPGAVRTGEPLLVATLWAVSSLFGGDATAAGWVLACYPVLAAVVSAYIVYRLTLFVTEDRRVALAAVLLLAITPAHAFRTSLGFADHHAFDYVWLAVTAYALVRLNGYGDGDWRERRQWAWVGTLGLGIGGQILAWDAGLLLVVPLPIYVTLRVLGDMRDGRAPVVANLPLLGGVTLGSLVVIIGHVQVGWHSGTVAFSPVLLTLGVLGVLGAGELAHRYDTSVRVLAAVEFFGMIVGLLALRTLRPGYWAEMMDGIGRITASRNIAETQSLLSGDTLGWLLLFGFVLVLAVPFLALQSVATYRGEREWLVPVVYGWYFLLLAMYQVRFAGQLAMFASVFAGLGFVYLAAAVDLTERPVPFGGDLAGQSNVSLPSRGTLAPLAVLFLLVTGLSVVQVPIKTSQVVTDGDKYQTAARMNEYATEQGWEYPQNYVFSRWGENRMYNYFVNGESQFYGFAQNNYDDFATTDRGRQWYQRLQDRVGFVVVSDAGYSTGTLHGQLLQTFEDSSSGSSEIGHYRAVHVSDGGNPKAFTLVPGARLTGPAEPNTSYSVSTDVTIDGRSYTYTREVETGRAGIYTVTVPYPGEYDVNGTSVSVSEANVRNGQIFAQFEGEGEMYWSFDAGSGETAYDRVGGYHGQIQNSTWTDGVSETGLRFDESKGSYVRAPPRQKDTASFTVSAWIRPAERSSGAILSTGKDGGSNSHYGILFDHGLSGWLDDRLGLYLGNGTHSASPSSPHLGLSYGTERYHHVAVVFDRGDLSWYLDGRRIGNETVRIQQVVHAGDRSTYLGREYSGYGGINNFDGGIDEVRYYEESLSNSEIAELSQRYSNETVPEP
jgi:dolichyl-diphosphooligosaccharide--protein glycosyltransferase